MKNELSITEIKKLKKSFLKKPVQVAFEQALFKTDLQSLAVKKERENSLLPNFTVEIPTLTITNQKQSGRCWLFAGLNVLREIIVKHYNLDATPTKRKTGGEFELSQNYIAFYDKLEKVNFFIESVVDFVDADLDDRVFQHILKTGIQDGGQWDMFVALVEKYGVVPKSAMPETNSSSSTGFINKTLNLKMRKFASDIRKKDADIPQLKEKLLDEVYTFLCVVFGNPTDAFDFEFIDKNDKYTLIKDLTPQKFYKETIGSSLDDYVSIINSPTDDKPFYKLYSVAYLGNVVGKDIKYLNLPLEELKSLTLTQLLDKEIVWFGSDVSNYGDREVGRWDDKLYGYETITGLNLNISKSEQLDYCHSSMNHAMVLTGVALDKDKPTKWKIENSWGKERGVAGYYLCSDSWFDKYVYQVVINKKYLSKEQLELWESKDITILKPWDPMGSLAEEE